MIKRYSCCFVFVLFASWCGAHVSHAGELMRGNSVECLAGATMCSQSAESADVNGGAKEGMHQVIQTKQVVLVGVRDAQRATTVATKSANSAAQMAGKAADNVALAEEALLRSETAIRAAEEVKRVFDEIEENVKKVRNYTAGIVQRAKDTFQKAEQSAEAAWRAFEMAEALRGVAAAFKQRAGTAVIEVEITNSSAEISAATRIATEAAQDTAVAVPAIAWSL